MVITASRLAAIAVVLCSVLSAASASPISIELAAATPDDYSAENNHNVKCPDMCKGVAPVNSTYYFCRDARLGLCAAQFLAKWTVNGAYTFPPDNGFVINTSNEPIKGNATLLTGTLVDRFGSENGTYLSPAEAPYQQRSLPPSSLDTPKEKPFYPYNYHVYKVVKPFVVEAGPIAAYFGQPGAGTQYHTFYNIMTLLEKGYLERVPLKHA
ncbi:hypothetical protein CPB97_010265 [Podila verticillata]|nr:hypothetical protein CPB97_010265 [Podila verticillata]